jgi:hypothetical protein
MPTAGRLAAALAFFIYGWYIGILATPFFPEANPPNSFLPVCVVVALLCGWIIVGSRAGNGYLAAIGNGLTGAFAFTVWIMFLLSFYNMIRRALRNLYDGPMEAVVDVFNLMLEMGLDFFDVNLVLSILVGGILCAFVSEYFAKRYP